MLMKRGSDACFMRMTQFCCLPHILAYKVCQTEFVAWSVSLILTLIVLNQRVLLLAHIIRSIYHSCNSEVNF